MSQVASGVMIGRAAERGLLEDSLAAACSGQPTLVVIAGDAGIGKTRLLEWHLGAAAEAGARVLRGACIDLGDQTPAFGALTDALRDLVRQEGAPRSRQLLGTARETLGTLVPDVGEAHATGRDRDDPDRVSYALLDGLLALAADRPLVLAIEDIHWADLSTLRLLSYLSRRLTEGRIHITVTERTDAIANHEEAASDLRQRSLAELRRGGISSVLEVSPLGPAEVHEFARARLGREPTESESRGLLARADGNPFHLDELLGSAGTATEATAPDVPRTVASVLRARLSLLTDGTRELLRAVALAGRDVHPRLAAALSELDQAALDRSFREALEHRVLVAAGDGYRFRHALVQETLRDELLPHRRRELHRRIAELLEADGSLTLGAPLPDALAHHWSAAGEVEAAFTSSVAAAERAAALPALPDAQRHLEKALVLLDEHPTLADEDQRRRLLLWCAEIAGATGDHPAAVRHLEEAASRLPGGPSEAAAHAYASWAEALKVVGLTDEALDASARGREIADQLPASRAQVLARCTFARIRLVRGSKAEEPQAAAEQALATAESLGDPHAIALAANTVGLAHGVHGRYPEAVVSMRRAVEVATDAGLDLELNRALNNLFVVVMDHGSHEERDQVVEEFTQFALSTDVLPIIGSAINLIENASSRGDFERAERLLERLERRDLRAEVAFDGLYARGRLCFFRGEADELETVITRWRSQLLIDDALSFRVAMHDLVAWLGLLRDDAALAIQGVEDRLAETGGDIRMNGEAEILPAIVAHLCLSGSVTGGVGRSVEEYLEIMEGLGGADEYPLTVGCVFGHPWARRAGYALARSGQDAVDAWTEARDVAPWPFEEAASLVGLAIAQAEHGDREAARASAAEALVLIDRHGFGWLRDRLAQVARRARIPVVSEGSGGAAVGDELGLTPREREVLILVSDGCTNGEIAERLTISPKTASVHVSNILAKLGAANRVEAAGIAHRHGLTTADARS